MTLNELRTNLTLMGSHFVGFMPEGIEDPRTNKEKTEDLIDQKQFNAFPNMLKGNLAIDYDGHAHIFDGAKWVQVIP